MPVSVLGKRRRAITDAWSHDLFLHGSNPGIIRVGIPTGTVFLWNSAPAGGKTLSVNSQKFLQTSFTGSLELLGHLLVSASYVAESGHENATLDFTPLDSDPSTPSTGTIFVDNAPTSMSGRPFLMSLIRSQSRWRDLASRFLSFTPEITDGGALNILSREGRIFRNGNQYELYVKILWSTNSLGATPITIVNIPTGFPIEDLNAWNPIHGFANISPTGTPGKSIHILRSRLIPNDSVPEAWELHLDIWAIGTPVTTSHYDVLQPEFMGEFNTLTIQMTLPEMIN